MSLAPRHRAPSDKNRTTVKSAAGKATQRARNKANGVGSHSGSSGTAKPITQYPYLDWSEVVDDVVHVSDIAGRITQSQMGANGLYSVTMYVPKSYAHSVLDAALAQESGLMYIRLYHAPLYLFDPVESDPDTDDTDDGDA